MRVLTASHGGGEQRQDLFVQGGAARGGLRGEDVAGAQILREQIQRQTHHNSTGKRGGGAGLVLVIALQVAGEGESCVSWPGPTGGAELLRNIGGVVAVTGSDDGGESQVFFREIYGHKQPEIHLIHLTSLTVFTTGALISKGGQGQKRVAVAPQEPPTDHFKAFSDVAKTGSMREERWGDEETRVKQVKVTCTICLIIKTKACTGEGLGGKCEEA